MKTIMIELKKERRSGVIISLLLTGLIGAFYAYIFFALRKDTLLALPLPPMDILLTQVYGVISVLNLFGMVIATCIIYNIEFVGNAVKKMRSLPISMASTYLCKFLLCIVLVLAATTIQNTTLAAIGVTQLPAGTFHGSSMLQFAVYSFATSLPVLSFMLFVSSLFENMWVSLGIGVAGFLSSMALAFVSGDAILLHPFVILLRPGVTMSAAPDYTVTLFAIIETMLFLALGMALAKHRQYE